MKVPRVAISDYFKEKYNHGHSRSELTGGYGFSAKSRASFHSTSSPSPRPPDISGVTSFDGSKTIDVTSDGLLKGMRGGKGAKVGGARVDHANLAKQLWKEEMKALRALEMQKKREQRAEGVVARVKERLEGKHEAEFKVFLEKHFKESRPSLEGVWQENKSSDRRKETIRKIHNNFYGHFWDRHKVPQPYSVLHPPQVPSQTLPPY